MLRNLFLLVMVLAFPHLPSAVAATPSHTCPVCSEGPLHCQRTMPDESTGQHPLEHARTSIWRCKRCGSRFMLVTPAGRLTKLGKK